MDEEQRRQLASQATSTLGRNLAVGGFGNPATYNVPKFPEQQMATTSDWSKNPEVAKAIASGNISAIEAATKKARDEGRGAFQPIEKNVPISELSANYQAGQEDRQMALARASEGGLLAGQRLQEQGRNRYYAFRQGLEGNRAQEALSTAGGRSPDVMRGAQAMVEAERMRQAQQGRSPMSQSPLNFGGMQFRQSGMGGFAPVRGFGDNWAMTLASGGQPYQPTFGAQQPTQPTTTSGFWNTVNGAMPSIAAPVKTPQTPTLAASVVGTPFANRIMKPEEDRFGGLKTAMGVPSMRRIGPAPFGLRS